MANPNVTFYRQADGVATPGAITFDDVHNIIHLGTDSPITSKFYGCGCAVRVDKTISVESVVTEAESTVDGNINFHHKCSAQFDVPGILLTASIPTSSGLFEGRATYSSSAQCTSGGGIKTTVNLRATATSKLSRPITTVISISVVYLPVE